MANLIEALVGILVLTAVIYAVSEFFYFDFFGIGKRRARREFPAAAAKLGLEFIAPRDSSDIGKIEGSYEGRRVTVAPDDNATINISVNGLPVIFLSTKVYEKKNFDTGSSVFDRFFRTRTTSRPDKIIHQVDKGGAALEFIPVFHRRWKRKLEFFEVSENGIRLSLKYGMNSYVPVNDLERLLPDLNRFALMLEDLLGKA